MIAPEKSMRRTQDVFQCHRRRDPIFDGQRLAEPQSGLQQRLALLFEQTAAAEQRGHFELAARLPAVFLGQLAFGIGERRGRILCRRAEFADRAGAGRNQSGLHQARHRIIRGPVDHFQPDRRERIGNFPSEKLFIWLCQPFPVQRRIAVHHD